MDHHGGRWFSDPQEMTARLAPLLADPERMRAIGRAALDALLTEPGADPERLAAIGCGAGGTIALELGRDGADLRGIAAINPGPPMPRPQDSAAIQGSVLICVGSEDPIDTGTAPGLCSRATGRRRRLTPVRLRRGRARPPPPAHRTPAVLPEVSRNRFGLG